jgi:hypothetical protein
VLCINIYATFVFHVVNFIFRRFEACQAQ